MRTAKKKKRPGRPRAAQRRPVLAARVQEEFLARIKASARKHGRNASEELMWLAEQGLIAIEFTEDMAARREQAFNEANAILAAAKAGAAEYTKTGAWFDFASVEELVERAVTRALERAGVKS